MVHASDAPEDNIAEERLTPEEGRVICHIDASQTPLLAAIVTNNYTLFVDDYEEILPNGEKYEYKYPEENSLKEIYDIVNFKFDAEKGDFEEYIYLTNDITDEQFIKTTSELLDHIDDNKKDNDYTEEELAQIEKFKEEVQHILDTYDGSVKHWKFQFPVCLVF